MDFLAFLAVMCPSHFCQSHVSFQSQSSEILSSHDLVESLPVICLQPRVIQNFKLSYIFLAKGAARRGAEGAQAPPLAIRILMFIS